MEKKLDDEPKEHIEQVKSLNQMRKEQADKINSEAMLSYKDLIDYIVLQIKNNIPAHNIHKDLCEHFNPNSHQYKK